MYRQCYQNYCMSDNISFWLPSPTHILLKKKKNEKKKCSKNKVSVQTKEQP